jgi:putative endonuclease
MATRASVFHVATAPPAAYQRGVRRRYFYVYIMSSRYGVLYTGVTNDIDRRASEHKSKELAGFTRRYNITRLVHVEVYDSPSDAIAREKQIKRWNRKKKLDLIRSENPTWRDLSEE